MLLAFQTRFRSNVPMTVNAVFNLFSQIFVHRNICYKKHLIHDSPNVFCQNELKINMPILLKLVVEANFLIYLTNCLSHVVHFFEIMGLFTKIYLLL